MRIKEEAKKDGSATDLNFSKGSPDDYSCGSSNDFETDYDDFK